MNNENIVSLLQDYQKKPDKNDMHNDILYRNEIESLISHDVTNKVNISISSCVEGNFPLEAANRSFYNRPSNLKALSSKVNDLNKSEKMNNFPFVKPLLDESMGSQPQISFIGDDTKNEMGKKTWAKRNFKATYFKTIMESEEYERFNAKFESIKRFKKGFLLMMVDKYRKRLNLLNDKLEGFGEMNNKILLELIKMETIDKKSGS